MIAERVFLFSHIKMLHQKCEKIARFFKIQMRLFKRLRPIVYMMHTIYIHSLVVDISVQDGKKLMTQPGFVPRIIGFKDSRLTN